MLMIHHLKRLYERPQQNSDGVPLSQEFDESSGPK